MNGFIALAAVLAAVTSGAGPVLDSMSFGKGENPAVSVTRHEDVQVVETAALSEEWVCRGRGKSYNLFNWRPKGWKPNANYTLVVKARSFAGENAFNDPVGTWSIRVTDVLTGVTMERKVEVRPAEGQGPVRLDR